MLLLQHIDRIALQLLLARYGLDMVLVAPREVIPGSYWGESEAGLIANRLYVRLDTPLHSALHESAHYICMTPERRAKLHTDAQGDDDEESAVCYLQILLSDAMGTPRARMFADMDAWGYSFRLGSTAQWFNHDAEDARLWLLDHQLIDSSGQPTFLSAYVHHAQS